MINLLLEELNIIENRYKIKLQTTKKYDCIAYLIYLKYLCDIGKYKYEEVIEKEDIYYLTLDTSKLSYHNVKEKLPLNSLLKKIKNINIKELVLEFINYVEKPIEFHNNNDQLLYIGFNHNIYSYYNINGNATYLITEFYENNYNLFKIFDKVLGINNKYIKN